MYMEIPQARKSWMNCKRGDEKGTRQKREQITQRYLSSYERGKVMTHKQGAKMYIRQHDTGWMGVFRNKYLVVKGNQKTAEQIS